MSLFRLKMQKWLSSVSSEIVSLAELEIFFLYSELRFEFADPAGLVHVEGFWLRGSLSVPACLHT